MAMFDRVHSLQANNSNFYHIAGNQTQIFNNYDPGEQSQILSMLDRSLIVLFVILKALATIDCSPISIPLNVPFSSRNVCKEHGPT